MESRAASDNSSSSSQRKRKATEMMETEQSNDLSDSEIQNVLDTIKTWLSENYQKEMTMEGKWKTFLQTLFLNEKPDLIRECGRVGQLLGLEGVDSDDSNNDVQRLLEAIRNKMNKPRLPKSEQTPKSPVTDLRQAFDETYNGNAMENFIEALEKCHKDWKDEERNGGYFSPYIAIIQSSGYGKSRMCKEFACTNLDYLTVYICLRSLGIAGYPLGHTDTIKFLENLAHNANPEQSNTSRARFILKLETWIQCWQIVRNLHLILFSEKYPHCNDTILVLSPSELSEIISNVWQKGSNWWHGKQIGKNEQPVILKKERVAFWNLCQNSETANQLHTTCVEVLFGMETDRLDELFELTTSDVKNRLPKSSKEYNFLLVIDEARFLVNTEVKNSSEKHDNLFRLLRHALKDIKNRCVFAALVDTTSRLSNFAPVANFDSSQRESVGTVGADKNLFPPFTWVTTMDVLCHDVDTCSNLNDAQATSPDDIEMKEKERIFTLGRPLWKSTFQAYKGIDITMKLVNLRDFAWNKLSRGVALDGAQENDEGQQIAKRTAAIAVLSVLTGLNVSPESSTAQDLVASHMATCLGISKARDDIFIGYPVEPILTAAALWKLVGTVDNGTFKRSVLDPLLHYVRVGVVNAGYNGEFVVKLLLLLAQGKALKKTEDKFVPIELKDFLEELVGEKEINKKYDHGQTIIDELKITDSYKLSFSCFSKIERNLMGKKTAKKFWESCNPDNFLKSFFNRSAAMEFPNNHIGADLLIPVRVHGVNNEDNVPVTLYKYILVQVKNVVRFTSEDNTAKNLTPENVFGDNSNWVKFDAGFGIIINVGVYEKKVHINVYEHADEKRHCLIINGLELYKDMFGFNNTSTNDRDSSDSEDLEAEDVKAEGLETWPQIVQGLKQILHGRSIFDIFTNKKEKGYVRDYYKLWNI